MLSVSPLVFIGSCIRSLEVYPETPVGQFYPVSVHSWDKTMILMLPAKYAQSFLKRLFSLGVATEIRKIGRGALAI
jgi:hypothetical protein